MKPITFEGMWPMSSKPRKAAAGTSEPTMMQRFVKFQERRAREHVSRLIG